MALRSQLEEFLILGVDFGSNRVDSESHESMAGGQAASFASSTKWCADDHLRKWKATVERRKAMVVELQKEKALLEQEMNEIANAQVETMYRAFLLQANKRLLMSVANYLQQLQMAVHTKDYLQIPEIVQQILGLRSSSGAPLYLPPNTKIRVLLDDVVKRVASKILQDFQSSFEAHLQGTVEFEGVGEYDNDDTTKGRSIKQWQAFFDDARKWLAAYSLVTLLPLALTGNKNQCLQKYADALDEVLSPLWARFYFHLTSARESNLIDQYLWTFSYALTFIKLLLEICTEITGLGQLQLLCPGDYRKVGLESIVGKSMNFMRSHIAHVFEKILQNHETNAGDLEPSATFPSHKEATIVNTTTVMEIVEHSLEFDQSIQSLLLDLPQTQSVHVVTAASHIIWELKVVHKIWVEHDFIYFYSRLSDCFGACGTAGDVPQVDIERLFESSFGERVIEKSMIAIAFSDKCAPLQLTATGGASKRASKYSGFRCYQSVYECIGMLHSACQRYSRFLLPAAQDDFSETVLEPLLLCVVALFLYRIRSQLQLANLAIADASENDSGQLSQSLSTASFSESEGAFAVLSEFMASTQYSLSCLDALDSHRDSIACRRGRIVSRWKAVQAWIPRRLADASDNKKIRYSPGKLLQRIFDCSEQSADENVGSLSTFGEQLDFAKSQCRHLASILETNYQKLTT